MCKKALLNTLTAKNENFRLQARTACRRIVSMYKCCKRADKCYRNRNYSSIHTFIKGCEIVHSCQAKSTGYLRRTLLLSEYFSGILGLVLFSTKIAEERTLCGGNICFPEVAIMSSASKSGSREIILNLYQCFMEGE